MKPAIDISGAAGLGSGGSRSRPSIAPAVITPARPATITPYGGDRDSTPRNYVTPLGLHGSGQFDDLYRKRREEIGESAEVEASRSISRQSSKGALIGLSKTATLEIIGKSEERVAKRSAEVKKSLGVKEGGAQTVTATSAALPSNAVAPVSSVPAPVAGLPPVQELFGSGDLNEDVTFTPFTLRLWDKVSGGVISSSDLAGGLSDKRIPVGRYILRFKVPVGAEAPFFAIRNSIPFTIEGKKAVLEKAKLDPVAGSLTVQVNLLENPIPVLLLVAAAAGAIGLGGWGLSSSLDSLDKVVVDTSSSVTQLLIVGGIAFLVWRFFIK